MSETRKLQIGDQVRPNPSHESYGKYDNQYVGVGLVTGTDGFWVTVKWENGNGFGYPEGLLMLYDGKPFTDPIRQIYKTGDRVTPNPDGDNYERYLKQHEGTDGTVTEDQRSRNNTVRIQWDNGHRNGYDRKDVLPISEKVIEDPSNIELPFLIGDRVCLNPEGSSYQEYDSKVERTAGYVVGCLNSDSNLLKWFTRNRSSRLSEIYVVKFDNGRTFKFKTSNLLKIEGGDKTVTKFEFANGDTKYIVEGESSEDVDYYVIQNSVNIHNRTIYDKDWKDNFIEQMKSYTVKPTGSAKKK